MKNVFFFLFFMTPGILYANTISNIVNFNGETYSTCSVKIVSPQMNMGTIRASWGPSYALANETTGTAEIQLSECDPGTKITIKAEGEMDSSSFNPTLWLKNSDASGPQDLYVTSYITNPDNNNVHWLKLNKTDGYSYTIQTGKNGVNLTLKSVLRRNSTSVYPVGKYSARMTLFFEFQ